MAFRDIDDPRRLEALYRYDILDTSREDPFDIIVGLAIEREKDDLLRQKDNLLREVNHRIKNNLQLVSSLLALQSRAAANSGVRTQLGAAALRISAIGRAHQRLYRLNDLTTMDLGRYLRRLSVRILRNRFRTVAENRP
jgi:two-component sensor histidine kinase